MPGNVSSSAAVAELRLIGEPGAADPPPPAPGPPPSVAAPGTAAPGGGVSPITISSPSTTFCAMFTKDRSVPGSGPPAASGASAIREPDGTRTKPGCRTLPSTAMTSIAVALGETDVGDCVGGPAAGGGPIATGDADAPTATVAGRDRQARNAETTTTIAAITA